MKRIIILIALMTATAIAALPVVESVKRIPLGDNEEFYYPQFSPDGDKILLTRSNYIGLWELNLKTNRIIHITDNLSAGYEASYTPDGKSIYYLKDVYENNRRFRHLMKYDTDSKGVREVIGKTRLLTHPLLVSTNGVTLRADSKVVLVDSQNKDIATVEPFVHTFENVLTLVVDGKEKVLTPSGTGNYLWASLSPDRRKILYNKAGFGTSICDLQGNVLTELGYANAPVWSPNGKWIAYMTDYDDGHFYTESEIWIASADGKEKKQLTFTSDTIEMYPRWSPDNLRLVYHDEQGHIYILKLSVVE
jgi:Tol biopolymer transport system component